MRENPYPELSKAQRFTPHAQVIASFVAWANREGESLASSPEELEEQLIAFFGINREQLAAEQAASEAEQRKVQDMIERYAEKHGRPVG